MCNVDGVVWKGDGLVGCRFGRYRVLQDKYITTVA